MLTEYNNNNTEEKVQKVTVGCPLENNQRDDDNSSSNAVVKYGTRFKLPFASLKDFRPNRKEVSINFAILI